MARRNWSAEEDEVLILNYRSMRYEEIVNLLPDRSESSIKNRIFRLQKTGEIPETKHWTEAEIEFLCKNWTSQSSDVIADHLGRTRWSVERKITKLRLMSETIAKKKTYKHEWSDIDDATIKLMLSNKSVEEISLMVNKDTQAVTRRIKALGLSKPHTRSEHTKAKTATHVCRTCGEKFTVTASLLPKYCSNICRHIGSRKTKPTQEELHIVYFDHKKTASTIARLYGVSDATVSKWLTDANIPKRGNSKLQQLEEVQRKRIETRIENNTLLPTGGGYKNVASGIRVDLSKTFFRSGWEANLARVLNHLNIKWEYEPHVFVFKNIKKGRVAYVPDFYIPYHPGEKADIWIEVKGRMNPGDYTKLLEFKRQYPSDFNKLRGVLQKNSKAHKSFKKLGIPTLYFYGDMRSKYRDIISNWEGK
jgi:transposase